MNDALAVAPEVAEALAAGRAIVALESTIVTHGMPYPENVATAREVESLVRAGGAVPATIAIVDGAIKVGLNDAELEWLGTATDVMKLSRADLPFAVAAERHGSTTVAATMLVAHLAGITVFATGGIGGVHRGAEETFDVSADLEELARTPVAVVCAGAKALLDIPKTLEFLETRGVPVVAYGTDEFPAFWSRTSGLRAPLRLDTADAIAAFVHAKRDLGIESGTVIANPILETDEIPATVMAHYIETAVNESLDAGIKGKAVTPWLLKRIFEITGGKSLSANVALVKNNARLASAIAIALLNG
ncbi:MAG: pseudouridine-5'-phosphate glycosidase [Candidatus Eremiobacteraeota bacterium]|nr:pseudouridine-5'-phosphate glycosidase [Candidatus Eremiobacteraeota bacterium]